VKRIRFDVAVDVEHDDEVRDIRRALLELLRHRRPCIVATAEDWLREQYELVRRPEPVSESRGREGEHVHRYTRKGKGRKS
jgi:hypothetical protein